MLTSNKSLKNKSLKSNRKTREMLTSMLKALVKMFKEFFYFRIMYLTRLNFKLRDK